MTSMNQVYDFIHVSSYVWHVIGYLIIGILCIVAAGKLVHKQELSQEGFYFGFAKYVVSGFLTVSFYVVLMGNRVSGWHQAICVIASMVLYVVLVCLFDMDKSKELLRRMRIVRNS